MRAGPWQIGMCGTFDVANYGDLLFPLIAESELRERLGPVTLHRFSYHARTPPHWPYEVTSVTALPETIRHLDGLLIGGGFVLRFDKEVAPGYEPPSPQIHHPTGYWLTPALLALQHDVPLVWNAPGMDGNQIPAWANPLMERVLTLSSYVSVRDDTSRAALEALTTAPVAVVPDTVFSLPRMVDLDGAPSAAFTELCDASGLRGPYIIIQAARGMEGFVRFVKAHADRFSGFRFLALPMGPVLGDHHEAIDADLPGVVRLAAWPAPLLLAEVIGRAEAVVGQSYHLFITALVSGVPVFTRQQLSGGKFAGLRHFETFELPSEDALEPEWFLSRVGRRAPSALARGASEPLGRHWDRIAEALRVRRKRTSRALNRFWQALPALLEGPAAQADAAVAALETERREARRGLQDAVTLLDHASAEGAETQERLDRASRQLAIVSTEAAARRMQLDDATAQLTAVRTEAAARARDTAAAASRVQQQLDDTQRLLATERVDAAAQQAHLQADLDDALRELAVARDTALLRAEQLDDSSRRLDTAHAGMAARDRRIEALMASTSWRLTAPVRFVGRQLRKHGDSR